MNYAKPPECAPPSRWSTTCAAEFDAATPYFWSTYEAENEAVVSGEPAAVVLGSGPIRIGQGIEFDYCSVHSAWALEDAGRESVLINSNPETVSTDFDTSSSPLLRGPRRGKRRRGAP